MKKLALIALMGWLSTPLWAQTTKAPSESAATRAAKQVERMDEALDLSEAQKEILEEKLTEQIAFQREKRAAIQKMKLELEASRAEQELMILEVLDETQQQQFKAQQAREKQKMEQQRTSKGKAR